MKCFAVAGWRSEGVIPEPDTDSLGLEDQFLRRSGWQVVSREQSMLKEREREREKRHVGYVIINQACVSYD